MIRAIRSFILHDFWLKLFSLVLAVFIWLTVWFVRRGDAPLRFLTNDAHPQTYYNVPVLVVSSAAEPRGFRVDPSVVTVTVRGDKKAMQKLQPKDIRVVVDLTGIEEAARGLRKRVDVTTPTGTSPVQVEPSEVEVIVPSSR
jgi:YbbR domain-containing protein